MGKGHETGPAKAKGTVESEAGVGIRRRLLAAALACAALAAAGGSAARAAEADNAVRMEPVVVTATRIEQKVSEVASTVTVVTREEIESLSPTVAGDVLQGIPGVDVQRSGSPGSRENIKIRGGAGRYNLVMIDGIPVNSPTLGSFDIGALPADLFERVEVVRGAQSALYGSYAMTGVVNFIPRSAGERTEGGVSLAAGSRSTLQGNGFVRGKGSWGSGFAGATGLTSDGILPNDDATLSTFLGSADLAVAKGQRLHLLLFSANEEKGIAVDDIPRDINHRMKRRDLVYGARWEGNLTSALSLAAAASFAEEKIRDNDPPDPGETAAQRSEDTTRKTVYRVEARYAPSPRTTTFLGAEYNRDESNSLYAYIDPLFPFSSSMSAATYNRSIYLQEELRPTKVSGVSLGARLDRNSEAGTELNPRAASYYDVRAIGTRLHAAVGRGFRVPSPSDKFDASRGNPDLKPETAISYEAGAEKNLPDGWGRLGATWFYQRFRGLIQPDPALPGPTPGSFRLNNIGHAVARGIEADGVLAPSPWVGLALSYTYTDTWESQSGRRILGIPKQKGSVSALLGPYGPYDGRIDWRIESDQRDWSPFGWYPGVRPGYARVDAGARCRLRPAAGSGIREAHLTGKVTNLLDRRYEERLGIPAPGIGFLLGLELAI